VPATRRINAVRRRAPRRWTAPTAGTPRAPRHWPLAVSPPTTTSFVTDVGAHARRRRHIVCATIALVGGGPSLVSADFVQLWDKGKQLVQPQLPRHAYSRLSLASRGRRDLLLGLLVLSVGVRPRNVPQAQDIHAFLLFVVDAGFAHGHLA